LTAYYRAGVRPLWRREPVSALQEHYKYIQYVEAHWQADGGLTHPRRKALAKRLTSLAWRSDGLDRATHQAVWQDLERIYPDYIPDGASPSFQAAIRILGYRRADTLARRYLRVKNAFRKKSD